MRPEFRPIIAITMGDAAGVGAEIVNKALASREVYDICRPLVIGDLGVLNDSMNVAKVNIRFKTVKDPSEAEFEFGTVDLIDLMNIDIKKLVMGKPQAMAGKASVQYVEKAIELGVKGKIHAIATAPLDKEAMRMAGYDYAGHTEILAHLTNTRDYAMMLVAKNLRVVHVTTHISMSETCSLIKRDRVLKTIRLTHEAMISLGIRSAKIAVAGFNPHAGESGIFGREEIEEIKPAIEEAQNSGIDAHGPYPPDTVFLRASRGEFDVVVAMYHDQGHIPVKMLGFESGVNVTIGLPVIRTSVDHGTAYRRAGLRLGTADPTSLVEAVRLATEIARERFKLDRLK